MNRRLAIVFAMIAVGASMQLDPGVPLFVRLTALVLVGLHCAVVIRTA